MTAPAPLLLAEMSVSRHFTYRSRQIEFWNHTAREGCIILPRVLREMVMSSSDRALVVTA
jgi:hypothetical protein